MRNFFSNILLASTLLASPITFSAEDLASTEDLHAVEISIGSIGTRIDVKAYRKLRHIIGTAVSNNVIDKFIVYDYGIEGGFSGCVEGNTTAAPSMAFEKFVKRLDTIQPKSGTSYSFTPTTACLSLPDALNITQNQPKPTPLQAPMQRAAITQYKCKTEVVDGTATCLQYKCTVNCSIPKNWKFNQQFPGLCPNNPPSNCP